GTTISSLCPGTYTGTVTDANGCFTTATVIITEPPALTVSSTSTNATCNGACDGTASITGSGGTAPYTYTWSNGSSGSIISSLCAGIYTGTVKDINNCQTITTVIIAQPTSVTAIASGTNVTCNGTCDGTATISGSGGTLPYTFTWSNGGIGTSIISLCPGTYTGTVTDANGCFTTSAVTITEPSAVTVSTNSTNVTCNGACDGTATISGGGGTAPLTFTWSTGASGTSISSLCPGTYTGTVTDANGCFTTSAVTITQPLGLTVSATSTNVTCNGACNGTASISGSGGTAPLTYSWSNGSSGSSISGLCAGSYTGTVTDANGCQTTSSLTITEPTAMTLSTGKTDATCGNSDGTASVTASGGVPGYSIIWSTGDTTTTITGLSSGNYEVTVTDANGCQTTASVLVNDLGSPDAGISTSTDVSCNGGSDGSATVTANGGTLPYTYNWSSGSTTESISNVPAGTYTVTVSDANDCKALVNVTISEPLALTTTFSTIDVSCNGLCDGVVDLTVSGGTSPYTYNWNTGLTTQDLTGLCAGTYTVTIVDAGGGSSTNLYLETFDGANTWILNTPTGVNGADNNFWAINDNEGGVAPTGCGVANNGDNTLHITSVWNPTGGAAYDAGGACGILFCPETNMRAESPDISTVGNSGLTLTFDYIGNGDALLDNASLLYSTDGGITWITLDPSLKSPICGGGQGQWTAASYSLPASCENISNLKIGFNWTNNDDGIGTDPSFAVNNVSISTSSSGGCTVVSTVTINEPPILTISITSIDVTCNGTCDGTATISGSGGTAPLTYTWSNGSSGSTISSLCPGTYTGTVTDANGCQTTASVTIVQPTALSAAASGTNVTCNGACDGTASISGSGGTPPLTYNWSNGGVGASISGLCPGTYIGTVTDANGCQTTSSVTITEPLALTVSTTGTDVTCNGACDGTATISGSGGISPWTYTWSNGASGTTIIGLCPGTYVGTVTDANGCQTNSSVTITEPLTIAAITTGTDVICNGACDGTATISGSGGTSPWTYAWSNGGSGTTIIGLCPGTYVGTLTDANGCQTISSVAITEPTAIALTTGSTDATCGNADGTASVTATGGTGPYTYNWSNGQTTQIATSLLPGTYGITVTDNNGCQAVTSVTVIDPGSPSVGISTSTNVSCNGGNDGSATVTATGGIAPYTYSWSNGQTTAIATNLSASSYDVTVFDASSCLATASVIITEPTAITLTTGSTDATCGNADGTASVTATGGTAPYTYNWSNSQTTQTATSLLPGTYGITVTDNNGCQAVTSVTVIDPGSPNAGISTSTDVSCNGGNDGSATVTANGGVLPYTYSWSNSQTTATATNLSAGSYDVTVFDANGCLSTASVIITEPTAITLTTGSTNATCGNADGTASVTATGGTGP
ncbi:SprB repeat-containing protein, partial [Candidatus Amoebophilus asiaticus]|nr:SprB repeat-containing protein [Candidatus Amoebophilus asiaticus]